MLLTRKLLPTLIVACCALVFAAPTGHPQVGGKRIETPARTAVPRNQPPPQVPPTLVPQNLAVPPALPAQSIRIQPRPFNLDTALARLFADLKAVAAAGDFELSVTNAGKVSVSTLPLTLHFMEGRARTELDLSSVPVRIDSTGPFTAFRAAGISRIVTLTMSSVGVRLTHQVFPEAKAYLTQDLPDDEIPALIRMEKKPLGKDPANGLDKYLAVLTYNSGEKREARLWQNAGTTPQPVQIQFDIGDSLITIRIRTVQNLADSRTRESAQQNAALFQIPSDYTKHFDVGHLLQAHSARQTRVRR